MKQIRDNKDRYQINICACMSVRFYATSDGRACWLIWMGLDMKHSSRW